jgi:hypothetical protein
MPDLTSPRHIPTLPIAAGLTHEIAIVDQLSILKRFIAENRVVLRALMAIFGCVSPRYDQCTVSHALPLPLTPSLSLRAGRGRDPQMPGSSPGRRVRG